VFGILSDLTEVRINRQFLLKVSRTEFQTTSPMGLNVDNVTDRWTDVTFTLGTFLLCSELLVILLVFNFACIQ